MLYLKLMHTDHSCIEKSDVETKHVIFENCFLTKTKYNWKSTTPLDRLTAHGSALANLIVTYIQLYRAQYSSGHQSLLSYEDRVTCAVGISGQKFIHL